MRTQSIFCEHMTSLDYPWVPAAMKENDCALDCRASGGPDLTLEPCQGHLLPNTKRGHFTTEKAAWQIQMNKWFKNERTFESQLFKARTIRAEQNQRTKPFKMEGFQSVKQDAMMF